MTKKVIERVQTGVRMEKRMVKVLKALAEDKDMTLGALFECIFLHAFDGKCVFSPETRERIAILCDFYQLNLTSDDAHCFGEQHEA